LNLILEFSDFFSRSKRRPFSTALLCTARYLSVFLVIGSREFGAKKRDNGKSNYVGKSSKMNVIDFTLFLNFGVGMHGK